MYVFLYIKLLYVYQAGIGSLGDLLAGIPSFFTQMKKPIFAAQLQEFFVINVLLFGVFAICNSRLALIAFGALLPNILTGIGGAEKNGWATHYHSMYFPFLVFASAVGFSYLWIWLKNTKYRLALIGLLFGLITGISNYSPVYGSLNGAIKRLYNYYGKASQSSEKHQFDNLNQLASAVPMGSSVTTLEIFMPALYRDRDIYFYPVGIDVADYAVVIQVPQPDGSFYYSGAISYLPGETQKVDMCLTERLKKAGYNVEKPRLLLGSLP